MTLTLETLPSPDSSLRRLDPRWKLAALGCLGLMVASLRTLPAALLALAGAWLLLVASRLSPRWYLPRIGAVAAVLLVFVCLLPVLIDHGGPAWSLGPVRFTWDGTRLALLLLSKALALVGLMFVLLVTAPLQTTLAAAHALHLPDLLAQLLLLTYRYVYLLGHELDRLRVALRVRGYRNRMDRHSYRTIGHVAGTLLVRGYERAERVGHAMRTRGFDGTFRSLTSFQTTPGDVLFFLLLVGLGVGLVVLDRVPW